MRGPHLFSECSPLLASALTLLLLLSPAVSALSLADAPDASTWTDILNWGFEDTGLPAPWHLYGNPTWGAAAGRAIAGNGSLWCARSGSAGRAPAEGYADNMNAWITYGPFDLSDAVASQWSFHYWLAAKDAGDVLRWGASYDGTNYRYWAADAIVGGTSGWREEVFDLTRVYEYGNLCGRPQVWVAIWFTSDDTGAAEGAYVDEMRIIKEVPQITPRCMLPLVLRGAHDSDW